MDAKSDGFDLRLKQNMENDRNVHRANRLSNPRSSVGYLAKPMLKIRKKHIADHLTSNSLEWREDESNSSSKYKRNKIRNELMPLLSEIAGGDHALQKRFSNLEQQSRDIATDISARSAKYLRTLPSSSEFLLSENTESKFGIVQEEALHQWIMQKTNKELQLPYDQMIRIRNQILNHPDRLQWTLDVGNLWKLQRNGETLSVYKSKGKSHGPANGGLKSGDTLLWSIDRSEIVDSSIHAQEDNHEDDTHVLCFDSLPLGDEHSSIKIVLVKDFGNVKFTPPWRKGRSAIKIKEFLRGQKIPLHRRDEATILCLSDDSSKHVLAVYLEAVGDDGADKWIVNADFCPQDGLSVTNVVLRKTSLS